MKKYNGALSQNKSAFHNQFNASVNDAFLISDSRGKILYVNDSIENVTGLKVEAHLGNYIQELLRQKLITHSATYEAVKKKRGVMRTLNTKAGKRLLSTASPVFGTTGRFDRVVCNIKDISNNTLSSSVEQRVEPFNFKDNEVFSEVVKFGNEGFEIAFASEAMSSLVQMAINLGKVDTSVLIFGETGVGKDLIARLIHNSSIRAQQGSFVKVNCASLSENLFEAELFGYAPGSFTGALKTGKTGYVEKANKGTLFLDEVAELPLNMQAKLLGVLQDKEVFPIGSTKSNLLDVRIIAATNRNLKDMVARGNFRKDLYYRLNVIPMEVPPLRKRKEDIPVLVSYFKNILENKYFINKEISQDVNKFFISQSWPGNVRELANMVENLLITVPKKVIDVSSLPNSCFEQLSSDTLDEGEFEGTLKEMVWQYEAAVINKLLQQNVTQEEAARMLGISRSTLVRKISP